MSLRRLLPILASLGLGCGGSQSAASDEPTTAKAKQLREAQASGEVDAGGARTRHWGGWRFKGSRDDCFFIVGAKCFKTDGAACQAARCAAPKRCTVVGAAPAQVSCR